MRGEVRQDPVLGLLDPDHRRPYLLGQAGLLVHLADHVEHAVQRLVVRVDHHVDAVAQHVELGIGDQSGNLDELVLAQIETGHLTVDPHQKITHDAQPSPRPAVPLRCVTGARGRIG